MSVSYSAGVFFGVVVERRSVVGKRLDAYIEEQGGTPAKTEVDGVEIGMVGSQWDGRIWLTVQAKGSARSYSRDDELKSPKLLEERPEWRPAIETFMSQVSKNKFAIGWHFYGSEW